MLPPPQKKPDFAAQQDTPVMQEMKRQRGQAPRMEVIDILKQSAEGSGQNPIAVYNALAQLVETDPNFRVMRANNTLFIYNNNKDGSVDILMETADSPRGLVESIKDFGKAMKIAGFKTGKFDISNPQIIKAIQMAGLKVNMKSTGGLMGDGKTPAMMGIVEF